LAFALLALLSVSLGLTLALVGWPRLQSVSLHYDLVRLRDDVEGLQHQSLDLESRLEALRAPQSLAVQAEKIGLAPPEPFAVSEERGGGR
jgi:hypothetical protein